jgi:hypothetical protein
VATFLVFHQRSSYVLARTHYSPPPLLQLHGLYIINVDASPSIDSAKVVLVRPYLDSAPRPHHQISCLQLTDRRVYFTWEDARRRDVPLFKDEEDVPEPSSPGTPSMAEEFDEAWPWVDLGFGGHHL